MVSVDAKKLEEIKKTQRVCEKAMDAVVLYLKNTANPTSEDAHKIIDEILSENNCESPEGHIVSGGIQSVDPHEYGTGILEKGKPIVIDIYPRSKSTGYFADMTRTVCIDDPSPQLQRLYDTVLAAQLFAISIIKPKVKCLDIQRAIEKFFEERGYITSGKGDYFPYKEGFVHGVGHGVGLDIHQSPRIGRESHDILEEGDIITIEPGLYYFDIGGVRLEDMVLVTKDGCEVLTNFPKQLRL